MHWREPIGTAVGTVGLIAWVGLGALIEIPAASLAEQHTIISFVLVSVIAVVFAAGGLVIFSLIAEQIDFWRLGYRVRQLSPKGYFSWLVGPKQCVYEERTSCGKIQRLSFVRIVLGDGYPAPCEVCLPSEEDWDLHMPSWARRRRNQIIEHMNKCFGAEHSRTRFVDPLANTSDLPPSI